MTVRFASSVRLTRSEVFGACQALADAGRVLTTAGTPVEAHALGALFDLLEDRLAITDGRAAPCRSVAPPGPDGEGVCDRSGQPGFASYSRESELTQ